jgi:hypothetical protein
LYRRPAYDTTVKVEALITVGSCPGPTVKALITAGFSAGRGPRGQEPTVMWITTGYHETVGEGGDGEWLFYSIA